MSPHDGAEGADPPPVHPSNGRDPTREDELDDDARRRRLLTLLDDGSSTPAGTGAPAGTASNGSAPGPAGWRSRLARVCALSVSEVGVDGAGVTVMAGVQSGPDGARDQLAATGELARRLEDLQLTAGEGPCLDAYRGGMPVLVGELAGETARWPGFAPEALRAGAVALFSLPLQVGAVRLGTLDLHRATPGALAHGQLADAVTLAALATEVLLELAEQPGITDVDAGGGATLPAGWLPDVHADVQVAAGMLSVRWGVSVATALLGLRARAFADGEPLHDLARRIVNREQTLEPPGNPAELGPAADHDPSDRPSTPDPEDNDS